MYRFLRALSIRMEKLGEKMPPARWIVLVFLAIILLGSVLLCLPVASRSGQSCEYLTALFTATSATCVTGLAVCDTFTQWSGFGQAVILLLIQVGGLGFMTILTIFFLALRTRIGLKKRMVMAALLGLNDMRGVVRLVRRILAGTLTLELCGAAILAVRFWSDVPPLTALWMGVFHAVSAFCNAGFDLMGRFQPGMSLAPYATDVTVNVVIMALIVLGGIGFFVWNDVLGNRFCWKKLSVYTRMVLSMTAILIVGGALLVGVFEWNNPATLGPMSAPEKCLAALFQSVTTRTAGFAAFDQTGLQDASKAVCAVWMLIGGSSGSTAGGMKTVTAAVLLLAAGRTMRGKRYLTVYSRTIAPEQVANAMAVAVMMGLMAFGGALALCVLDDVAFLNAIFETTSALGTVGLTAGVTPLLSAPSLLMLILFMFFGRVGIMTIGMGFLLTDRAEDRYHYAETKLLIG